MTYQDYQQIRDFGVALGIIVGACIGLICMACIKIRAHRNKGKQRNVLGL